MSLVEEWEEENYDRSSSSGYYYPSGQFGAPQQGFGSSAQVAQSTSSNSATNDPADIPIFTLDRVDYKPNGVKHMVVSSNILVMALSNCHIIRLNLKNESDLEDIEISRRPEDHIHKLFLDPTGNHLIISMDSEDNYYLHKNWKKPKIMTKMKGVIIESIAWDKQNTETYVTKDILIGTTKGKVFETTIDANDKAFMERLVGVKDQQGFKLVYNIGETNTPITGLRFERFLSVGPNDPPKYFIMMTTPTRIYQFIGGPTFEAVFTAYETNPTGFQELPGDLNYSELHFYSKYQQGLPKNFAWLTGPGIYYGDLIFGSQNAGESVTVDTALLPYDTMINDVGGSKSVSGLGSGLAPISMVLTEFHYILLYTDRIQAISILNKQVVWEERFGNNQPRGVGRYTPNNNGGIGRMIGLSIDPIERTTWLYGEFQIFEVVVTREDRNVWEMYLQKGQYEQALQHCKNMSQKDKVWTTQADYFYSTNNLKLSAIYYAKTLKSFEEISLKFINASDQNALNVYLLHKLENIKSNSKNTDATQMTLIATWLTEIYLDKLNQLESSSSSKETIDTYREEFEAFLKDYKDNLDKSTTINLISSHGRLNELLYYAIIIDDYDLVISHYIQSHQYLKALELLSKQSSEELYYKFSPILFHNLPYETAEVWIKGALPNSNNKNKNQQPSPPPLDPKKLIPSLMNYDPSYNPKNDKETNQAIRYLNHCVRKLNNKDSSIHNYLLSLYAKENNDKQLIQFIKSNDNDSDRYYDLKYALRICKEEHKIHACVIIYSYMELYEEAVDLAIHINLDLAKEIADRPFDDDSLRKKLWLRIARYVVEDKKDIKKAMELLNQCNLIKIEDILPFFPDFTRIDDFKQEICTSLEDYNRHINELKTEMEEATVSADLIRNDIKELRNKYGSVIPNYHKCGLCDYHILSKDFYLFPCNHLFHSDCLISEMMKHLDSVQRSRVNELLQQIQSLSGNSQSSKKKSTTSSTDGSKDDQVVNVVVSKMDRTKDELDDLIASECIYCGDIMISSIHDPFIRPSQIEDIRSWAI